MERIIKFKAKCIADGEWAKGYYYKKPSYKKAFNGDIVEDGEVYCIYGMTKDDVHTYWYEVDPSTVCQFTGLKDREGNDIFEGDLLAEDKIAVFEVGYTKCGFACSYLFHKHFMYDLYKISKTHVVCGSKFDRKEKK